MEKLTFKQLTRNILKNRFGLKQCNKHKVLTNWIELANLQTIDEMEQQMLIRLQKMLNSRASSWNEFELSEWFIGPVLALIEFDNENFTLFACRDISATVKDCELSGRPDVMIADGIDEPINPYFCFHEYKKQTDPNGNPQTQLLGAMLAAQTLNNNEKPIYGVYIIGFQWRFIVLQNLEWCESNIYISENTQLLDIIKMLKALKQIITNF